MTDDTPAVSLLRHRPRIFWARVIQVLIKQGWSPPKPDARVMAAVLDDIACTNREPRGWATESTLDLTPHELQALQLLADGNTVTEAAVAVGNARESMKYTYKRVYRKLGARNGSHAVAIGFRKGIIQ